MQKLLHVHTQITDCSSSIAEPYIQDANHRKIITDTCANNCSCHCITKVIQCLSSLSKYFVFSPKNLIKLVLNVIEHIADFRCFKYLSVHRKGRSCTDPKFCLKLLIEKRREFNLETHLLFIDYEKAFDNIQRQILL